MGDERTHSTQNGYFCFPFLERWEKELEQRLYDAIEENPIIAAVKDDVGLKKVCDLEEIRVVFVLYGDICSVARIVKYIKDSGKMAMVHMDLVSGFSAKEVSVDYIKNMTETDGIISTKSSLVKRGKELGLCTVLRFFVIDSIALKNISNVEQQSFECKPDFIEILPGIMPKIVKKVKKISHIPIIASGLICDKEDVMGVLEAGAVAISSTDKRVWKM